MPRLGGCPRCRGDLVVDSTGDIKCFQCGHIVEYSDYDGPPLISSGLQQNTPSKGRKTPRRIVADDDTTVEG